MPADTVTKTANMKSRLTMTKTVLAEAGLSAARALPVLAHNDATGLRPDVMVASASHVHPAVLRYLAAYHGLLHAAPAVVAFNAHADGAHKVHVIHSGLDPRATADALRTAGFPKFSLHGSTAYLYDPSGVFDLTPVLRTLNAHGYHAIPGTGRVVGAGEGAAPDEQRAHYRDAIRAGESAAATVADRAPDAGAAQSAPAAPLKLAAIRTPSKDETALIRKVAAKPKTVTPAHFAPLADYLQETRPDHPVGKWLAHIISQPDATFIHNKWDSKLPTQIETSVARGGNRRFEHRVSVEFGTHSLTVMAPATDKRALLEHMDDDAGLTEEPERKRLWQAAAELHFRDAAPGTKLARATGFVSAPLTTHPDSINALWDEAVTPGTLTRHEIVNHLLNGVTGAAADHLTRVMGHPETVISVHRRFQKQAHPLTAVAANRAIDDGRLDAEDSRRFAYGSVPEAELTEPLLHGSARHTVAYLIHPTSGRHFTVELTAPYGTQWPKAPDAAPLVKHPATRALADKLFGKKLSRSRWQEFVAAHPIHGGRGIGSAAARHVAEYVAGHPGAKVEEQDTPWHVSYGQVEVNTRHARLTMYGPEGTTVLTLPHESAEHAHAMVAAMGGRMGGYLHRLVDDDVRRGRLPPVKLSREALNPTEDETALVGRVKGLKRLTPADFAPLADKLQESDDPHRQIVGKWLGHLATHPETRVDHTQVGGKGHSAPRFVTELRHSYGDPNVAPHFLHSVRIHHGHSSFFLSAPVADAAAAHEHLTDAPIAGHPANTEMMRADINRHYGA